MKIKCLLLYAMPYSIADEKTGEINEGISCTYIPSDSLDPTVDDETGSLGIMTCKQSFNTDLLDKFVSVPGLYEVDFSMRSVKGKPVMTPNNLQFLGEVNLSVKKG